MTNGKDIVCARRRGVLAPNEDFFNYQQVLTRLQTQIRNSFSEIQSVAKQELNCVVIIGELFGGFYPGLTAARKEVIVQKGIYYSPQVEFCAFDIELVMDEGKNRQWMKYSDCMNIFEKLGLLYAKPLISGSMEECTKFNIKINSLLPKQLGLSDLNQNQIEGIVIKTGKRKLYLADSQKLHFQDQPINFGSNSHRIIFKIKNEKFAEINPSPSELIDRKWKKSKQKGPLPFEKVMMTIKPYLNFNRIETLQSKIGKIRRSIIDQAGQGLCDDALKDFLDEHKQLYTLLSPGEKKKLEKLVFKYSVDLIDVWLKNERKSS